MAQRRKAFEAYLGGGQGSVPLHRFFDRFHARDVSVHRTGLVLRIAGAGYLLMPWDCYDTALAGASHGERAKIELGEYAGQTYGLHWPDLDVDISVSGLVWDASLPMKPTDAHAPRGRTRNVVWMNRMPTSIVAWVAPAMKAVGREMPAFPPVAIRQVPSHEQPDHRVSDFEASTGCVWCDLELAHTHHLDEL